MSAPIIILIIIAAIILFIWFLYNSLVTARARVRESWSGIDVQLKRRSNLIPNLVKTVKSYAKHERTIYDRILKARQSLVSARTKVKQAEADNQITQALKTIFAIAESNPELKANQNFLELQQELSDTETKIAASRQFYNSTVMDYNIKIRVFPSILIARSLGFKSEEFFKTSEESRKNIEVDFES